MTLVPLVKLSLIYYLRNCIVLDSCLLQPRTLTVVDGKDVDLGPITYFIITQLSLRDELGEVHTKTLDLFPTKLDQYPIILGLPWFKKHSPHIWLDKIIITFNSSHCLQHCLRSHQTMTVSSLDTPFDHLPCLPILSDQALNISSANNLAPNFCFHSLSYHRYCFYPSPHQCQDLKEMNSIWVNR